MIDEGEPVAALSARRAVVFGLMGHALAVLVFLVVFLFDSEDPADRAAAAVGLSVLTGVAASVVTAGIAIRRFMKGHRDRCLAVMITSWAVGAVIGTIGVGLVLVRTSDWSSHCPCEPPVSLF